MALDPRLMMIDYSPIQKAAQTFTTGMQNRRMKQVEGLAGQALMGDPSAMQNLSQLDPMMAAKVQDQIAQQQAAQTQAGYQKQKFEMEKMDWRTSQQERYAKMFANARNYEEGKKLHDRLIKTDETYQMLNQMDVEQGGDSDYTADDHTAILTQLGKIGFGDVPKEKLIDLYRNFEPVKDLESTQTAYNSIKSSYRTFLENLDTPEKAIASAAAIGKLAVQLVEKGVVRPEDAQQFGGMRLPVDKNGNVSFTDEKARKEFIDQWAKGAMGTNQVESLVRMSQDVYNSKIDVVKGVQQRFIDRGIGGYSPDDIFISTGIVEPEKLDITISSRWDDEDWKAYQFAIDNPKDPDNPEIFKRLGL